MYKKTFGHIEPFWQLKHREFDYKKQPITVEETTAWEQQGYDYVKSFTGSMYDSRNPMPEWVNQFGGLFGLKNQTYNFYKMKTLEIMPTHSDHFRTYMRVFNTTHENVYRVLIMMEDWKPGHYLEVDGVGIVNWRAGDYYMWENFCPHAASNIGIDDRYSLQITGELIE